MSEEPHVGSMKPGPRTGAVLYALLGASAAIALVGNRASWIPPAWHAVAPVAFGLFLVLFAAYRFVLVRAGRYPAGKAFFHVGAGVLFLTLLLPSASRSFLTAPAAPTSDLPALLRHRDPTVRRLACEVARYRPDGVRYRDAVKARLDDPSLAVREECRRSLEALEGRARP